MTKSIIHQFFFQHPPAHVWEYLTNPDLMELWLMKNDFKLVVGHEFQFRTKPKLDFDFDGIFYCKVLAIAPFKNLSYSWKCGPGEGIITIDSVVNWTLEPKNNGTQLLLEHGDFAIMENMLMYNSMVDGWVKNVNKIIERLNESVNGSTNA